MKGMGTEKVTGEIVYGPFKLNTKSRKLTKNDVKVELTQVKRVIIATLSAKIVKYFKTVFALGCNVGI